MQAMRLKVSCLSISIARRGRVSNLRLHVPSSLPVRPAVLDAPVLATPETRAALPGLVRGPLRMAAESALACAAPVAAFAAGGHRVALLAPVLRRGPSPRGKKGRLPLPRTAAPLHVIARRPPLRAPAARRVLALLRRDRLPSIRARALTGPMRTSGEWTRRLRIGSSVAPVIPPLAPHRVSSALQCGALRLQPSPAPSVTAQRWPRALCGR
mmetsp:Transcript_25434/g.70875  ORF Transcript_25434/g.70875 Transcript_25434/m.70875 type:complete len:212 (-) Transcript_25434:1961-2596(-)